MVVNRNGNGRWKAALVVRATAHLQNLGGRVSPHPAENINAVEPIVDVIHDA